MNAESPPSPLLRYLPALDALRRYTWHDARSDLLAGLTVAAVSVPQGMAYAMVAGLPVEIGLYTAIVMTAVGALFSSSPQLVNGPTNAISIAVLSALAPVPADVHVQAAVGLALLVGSIQLLITALKLGDLSRYISHSVVIGFTLGASILLVLDQLKNLLGLKTMGDPHDAFLVRFAATMLHGGPVHLPTVALGGTALVAILAVRWLKARTGHALIPEFLLVTLAASAAVAWLGLEADGVRVVGDIPAKLPTFRVPEVRNEWVRPLSTSALAIATLGLLEAIAMSKAIAAQTRQKIDIQQLCLSEGVANLTGSLFQCFPGSGSLTRSYINQQAGARTQWAGIISAGAVAAVVVLFAPYARFIPRAALAAILIVSAFRMVDRHALLYHVRATRFDAVIVTVTALSAVVISIEFCILIGVFMSFLLAVPRAAQVLLTEFVVTPDRQIHERMPGEATCSRILIFGLEGEMFFGAAPDLEDHLATIERRAEQCGARVVVLRMKRVRNPDAVCLHELEHFVDRMRLRGVHVLFGGVRPDVHEAMKATGLARKLGDDDVFLEAPVRHSSTLAAIVHAYAIIGDDRCEHCPFGSMDPEDSGLYFAV